MTDKAWTDYQIKIEHTFSDWEAVWETAETRVYWLLRGLLAGRFGVEIISVSGEDQPPSSLALCVHTRRPMNSTERDELQWTILYYLDSALASCSWPKPGRVTRVSINGEGPEITYPELETEESATETSDGPCPHYINHGVCAACSDDYHD